MQTNVAWPYPGSHGKDGTEIEAMKVERFLSDEAYGVRCVRAEEFDRVEAERDALQGLLNERDEKLARYAEFLGWCESAPVGSGVCCCGDAMESHGHYADHGAVDEWDHSLDNWAKELRK